MRPKEYIRFLYFKLCWISSRNHIPKISETLDFQEALSWMKRKQTSNVRIELDALSVVRAFRNSSHDSSYFGSIIKDCCFIVKGLRILFGFFLFVDQRT